MNRYAIILAAGEGTRMRSKKNKVMHTILNKPMIGHVVKNLEEINVDQIFVVTGYEKESIESYLGDRVLYATQDEQNGTAHAVSKVAQLEGKKGSTLLVYGDSALIQKETLQAIFDAHGDHDLTIVSATLKDPGRYSRVIRDNQGKVKRVVEARNATELEATSNEINLGIYCFNNELLFKYLKEIHEDTQDEINIIELVSVLRENDHDIQTLKVDNSRQFMGINDRLELADANLWMRDKINREHMANGVSILDPMNTFIGPDVTIEADVIIEPGTHIYGKTEIKSGTTIGANSWVDDSKIGENVTILSSRITDSSIGNHSTVGPYAHLRMHTEIKNHVRVGNFVEMKHTIVDDHTNSAHLTYLGDTEVGKYVNIGCGVVTINYDGKNKSKTIIKDHTFIGSQSGLIAPVVVGENAVVAAGSIITDDVDDGDFAIARARQSVKEGYGKEYLKKKGKI